MKGVILAGGTGSRLDPLTRVTNKHLLAVWKKPMIYYPLQTLLDMGIKEIMIISGPGHAGHFVNLLGSGKQFGTKLSYEIQDEAGGIAQALGLCDDFADKGKIAVILGDNIFEDNFKGAADIFSKQQEGAHIFLKEVEHPERFGVAEFKGNSIKEIVEKPKKPKTNWVTTGLYMYDNTVFDIIKTLKPSWRNELEITDVNNEYLKRGMVSFTKVKGFWTDAGTFESLYNAATLVREKEGHER